MFAPLALTQNLDIASYETKMLAPPVFKQNVAPVVLKQDLDLLDMLKRLDRLGR